MTELEKLKLQKKEIEKRIRELNNQSAHAGCAMVGVEHYPTDKPDRWYVAIEATYKDGNRHDSMGRAAKRSIINGASRKAVIAGIPEVVRDLQALYDQEVGRNEG